MMNGMGSMGPLMWIFMILFWGVVIFGLVFAVRWILGRSKAGGESVGPETALEILKKRFARGEISKEEFERMKRELESPGSERKETGGSKYDQ